MESNSAYPAKYAGKGQLLAKTSALSTCALYYHGYEVAALMADRLGQDGDPYRTKALALKKAINKHFWQEDKGYYGYFLDENNQLCPAMEGLGEALCIRFAIAGPEQANQILQSTPTTQFGIPCLWPQWPEHMNYHVGDADFYHNGMIWPFVQGYWALAAIQTGDLTSFGNELNKLLILSEKNDTFQEFYHPEDGQPDGSPDQLWSASGYLAMVFHGLTGLNFEEKGIRFAPLVPAAFSRLTMSGIKYRQSVLNVKVVGNGARILTFKLDGATMSLPFFDASLKGRHNIEIQMQ
jgi:glycogen debranching enzyme